VTPKSKKCRKIAQKLLAQPADVTANVASVVLCHTQPLSEFDDSRVWRFDDAKRLRIGSQSGRQNVGITPIILGPRHGETITEAIKLLWIDRVHTETSLDQHLHNGTVRRLDRNKNIVGFGATFAHEPVRHMREPRTAVLERASGNRLAISIGQRNVILRTCPINAGEPSLHLRGHWLIPRCRAEIAIRV